MAICLSTAKNKAFLENKEQRPTLDFGFPHKRHKEFQDD